MWVVHDKAGVCVGAERGRVFREKFPKKKERFHKRKRKRMGKEKGREWEKKKEENGKRKGNEWETIAPKHQKGKYENGVTTS